MGWFLTGVWSSFLIALWVFALVNGVTGAIALITIFMILTSLVIGAEIQDSKY